MLIPAIVFGISIAVLLLASATFIVNFLHIVEEVMNGKKETEINSEYELYAGKSLVISVIAFSLLFADVFYCLTL